MVAHDRFVSVLAGSIGRVQCVPVVLSLENAVAYSQYFFRCEAFTSAAMADCSELCSLSSNAASLAQPKLAWRAFNH